MEEYNTDTKTDLVLATITIMKCAVSKMILDGDIYDIYKNDEISFYKFSPDDVTSIGAIEGWANISEFVFNLKDGRIFHENGDLIKDEHGHIVKSVGTIVTID